MGILFGVLLSEGSIIFSVLGQHLAFYCLKVVSYPRCGDNIWRSTVLRKYNILGVGITFGVLLSEGSIISSVLG